MHVQRRPEDWPPLLGSLLPGSGSAWQHVCSTLPQVRHRQPSSERRVMRLGPVCCAKHLALGLVCPTSREDRGAGNA